MHIYTKGESLERLKVTVSHIWGADPNGRWQRRGPGSAARGAVTCGTQRGGRADRIQFLSVILHPGEMFGLWLKALLSHIFIHF